MGNSNDASDGQFDPTDGIPFSGEMGNANQERCEPIRQAPKKKATAGELKALLEKQQYCCALSGLPLTPEAAALDHIVSVSDGGTHEIENLQWLSIDVNRMKGSMTQSRFLSIVSMIADNKKNGKVLR